MAPIKVGLIGLGATSGWARSAHLPYLKESGKYQIVAVCNSSVASSEAAIKAYGLPASTKAYGGYEDIAQDPNVELIVCSVRVDRHYASIVPAIKAGKDVFVEWPLGKSAAEARELLRLKNEYNVKTAIVGLQGRQALVFRKLKSLVEDGTIGKVLSSTLYSTAGVNDGKTYSEGSRYFADKEFGGNLLTIFFGHVVDYFQFVLGYGFKDPKALLETRHTHFNLVDGKGNILQENIPKNTDDTIFIQGTLSTGIPVSMTLRDGAPFPGTPGLEWRIFGDKGELRLTAPSAVLQAGSKNIKLELNTFDTGKVEQLEIPQDELSREVPNDPFGGFAAENVGRLYRGLAEGEVNCSFEDAVERHEFIEEIYKQNGYLSG